jgi:hypothetical protein
VLQAQKPDEEISAAMRVQPLVEYQSVLAAMPSSNATPARLRLKLRFFGLMIVGAAVLAAPWYSLLADFDSLNL